MLKSLRIAVTVLSLAACVLLIALWVRSYWWMDFSPKWGIASSQGKLCKYRVIALVAIQRRDPPEFRRPFGLSTFAADRVEIVQAYTWSAVPFWVLVLLALVLAAAPWMRWRFSLRTLLIATTLIAVALGIIMAAQ